MYTYTFASSLLAFPVSLSRHLLSLASMSLFPELYLCLFFLYLFLFLSFSLFLTKEIEEKKQRDLTFNLCSLSFLIPFVLRALYLLFLFLLNLLLFLESIYFYLSPILFPYSFSRSLPLPSLCSLFVVLYFSLSFFLSLPLSLSSLSFSL